MHESYQQMPACDNVRQISCVPFSLKESNNWETEINSLNQTLEQAPCKHARRGTNYFSLGHQVRPLANIFFHSIMDIASSKQSTVINFGASLIFPRKYAN